MTSTRLTAIARRAGLDALYLTIGLATSVLALGVWIAGVTVSLSLALFVVGLPIILLSAIVFRWTAELDRRNAMLALGSPLPAQYRDHGGERFLQRLSRTLGDRQTWKDLTWLVLHSVIGLAFGCVAVALVAENLALAVMPLWYWAIPDGVDWGILTIDTLPEALLGTLLAIPHAVITVALLRLMTIGESRLAQALLAPPSGGSQLSGRGFPRPSASAALAWHLAVSATVAAIVMIVWTATMPDTFWPAWVLYGLGVPLALHFGIYEAAAAAEDRRTRGMAIHATVAGILAAAAIVLWWLAGGGYFWPVWALLGLGVTIVVHAMLLAYWDRISRSARERRLADRVDVLTKTRRGALDVQAAELRRIERDLHDGAQARLVALSMHLGRAEERLADQPAVADLVRRARGEAGAAIAELRDLARGIAPPVLADRGLEAAVEALGRRSPLAVTVDVELTRRPVPVIETAAYFVVAESLTNAAKHAGGAAAHVTIRCKRDRLVVEVADDGPGGADPHGGGLTGLRHRVQALDGTLSITSPPGAGTTVRADLPSGT